MENKGIVGQILGYAKGEAEIRKRGQLTEVHGPLSRWRL